MKSKYIILILILLAIGCRKNDETRAMVILYIPNAFVPEGVNKTFGITVANPQDMKSLDWSVYTNEGQKLFSAKDASHNWDGTFNNQPMPRDNYYYIIKVIDINNSVKYWEGSFMLFR